MSATTTRSAEKLERDILRAYPADNTNCLAIYFTDFRRSVEAMAIIALYRQSACSKGQNDGINCQLGEAPAKTRAFEANGSFYYYPNLTRGQRYLIAILRRDARSILRRHGLSVRYPCPNDPIDHACEDAGLTGDANLYDGFLCLSGEDVSCQAVRQAQGANGRWWRSPYLIGQETGRSFSRDMALGTLAYLTATRARDISAQEREDAKNAGLGWLLYIRSHDGLMCTDDSGPLHDFCGLNHWRSLFFSSDEYHGIFRDVYDYIYGHEGSAYFGDNARTADADRKKSACEYIDKQHWTF